MTPPGPRLAVTADLHVEVDGSPVSVTASGGRVLVRVDDPAVAVAGLPPGVFHHLPWGPAAGRPGGAHGHGGVRVLTERLREAGVRVEVVGPAGPLVSVGDVPKTRLQTWLLQGAAIRVDGVRATVALALSFLRRRLRSRLTR